MQAVNYLLRKVMILDVAQKAVSKGLFKSFIISLLSSFLIGSFAFLKLYVPFTPIAFVLQMQIVFLLSLFLGAKKASLATILFLFQGMLGFPVLPSSTSLTLALGYYIGYVFSAYLIGTMVEKKRTYFNAFLAISLANYLVIYFLGAAILAQYIGLKKAIILGIFPFVIPDLCKNLLLLKLLKSLNWEKNERN